MISKNFDMGVNIILTLNKAFRSYVEIKLHKPLNLLSNAEKFLPQSAEIEV